MHNENTHTAQKHAPVITVPDYDQIDGRYANLPESDAKGLSIGLAQWNTRGKIDLSAKVWRYTGKSGHANQKNCLYTEYWIWRF